MANVLIVAYLLIVLAMIGVILMQRSEGGALGIGGGSGGGLVSARGSANLLSRTTAILAALFMSIAIALTIVADLDNATDTILDTASQSDSQGTVLDALDALQPENADNGALPVPTQTGTPATTNSDDSASAPTPPADTTADADAPDLALPADTATPAAPAETSN